MAKRVLFSLLSVCMCMVFFFNPVGNRNVCEARRLELGVGFWNCAPYPVEIRIYSPEADVEKDKPVDVFRVSARNEGTKPLGVTHYMREGERVLIVANITRGDGKIWRSARRFYTCDYYDRDVLVCLARGSELSLVVPGRRGLDCKDLGCL